MKQFLVDTVAAIVFFTFLAAATEYFIVGLSLEETAKTRLIMILS